MNNKKVEEHQEKYPISIDEISKLSSYEQILGRSRKEYTDEERKRRWDKAMSFDETGEARKLFGDVWECSGCKHQDNGWCSYAQLPCGVNPVLTIRYGILGLACQGKVEVIGKDEESE